MTVNGKEKNITQPILLKDYLLSENYTIAHIAVELDGKIIKKNDYENTILNNNSKIEIVRFMGGG